MYPEHIGKVIKKLRHEAHLTQAQLAEKTNMGRANLAMIEQGRNLSTLQTICRIFNTLGYGVKVKLVKPESNEY